MHFVVKLVNLYSIFGCGMMGTKQHSCLGTWGLQDNKNEREIRGIEWEFLL